MPTAGYGRCRPLAPPMQGRRVRATDPHRILWRGIMITTKRILPLMAAAALLALAGCSGDDASPTAATPVGGDDYAALDLNQTYGGLTASDEPVAFGDQTLAAELDAEAGSEADDPLADDPAVRRYEAMCQGEPAPGDSLRPRITYVTLRWGMLRGPEDTTAVTPPCDAVRLDRFGAHRRRRAGRPARAALRAPLRPPDLAAPGPAHRGLRVPHRLRLGRPGAGDHRAAGAGRRRQHRHGHGRSPGSARPWPTSCTSARPWSSWTSPWRTWAGWTGCSTWTTRACASR